LRHDRRLGTPLMDTISLWLLSRSSSPSEHPLNPSPQARHAEIVEKDVLDYPSASKAIYAKGTAAGKAG
jgi:hypothetical protein